jgi:hypothetical protein
MPGFNLSIDTAELERMREALRHVRGGMAKVLERSINRTLTGIRTAASKEIRKEVTVKAKYVKRSMRTHKASARKGRLAGAIESTGRQVPLIGYQARQTKRGVSVRVDRKGGRHLVPHAFIATMPSGHRGVFQRATRHPGARGYGSVPEGRDKRGDRQFAAMPRKYRLPIKELYGPAVPSIFKRGGVMRRLERQARERMDREIAQQTEHALERSGIRVERI